MAEFLILIALLFTVVLPIINILIIVGFIIYLTVKILKRRGKTIDVIFLIIGLVILIFSLFVFALGQKWDVKYFLNKAKSTNNSSYCQKAYSACGRDLCISQFANFKKDSTYCQSISGSAIKSVCFSEFVNFDTNVCKSIPKDPIEAPEGSSLSAECFYNAAILNLDENLCSEIGQSQNRNNTNRCITQIAKTKKDVNICNLTKSNESKLSCQMEVAIALKDLTLCQNYAKSNSERLNYCRAVFEKNASLCPRSYGIDCLIDIAITSGNPDFCQQSENNKVLCYEETAISTKDENVCKKIDTSIADNCFSNIAVLKSDISICDNIFYKPSAEKCKASIKG